MSDVTPSALELARRWHRARTLSNAPISVSDLDAFHNAAAEALAMEIAAGQIEPTSLGVSLEVADEFARPHGVHV